MEDFNMTIRCIFKIAMVLALLTSALPAWAQGGIGRNAQQGIRTGTCRYLFNSTPRGTLDSTEAAELAYLREEEKLARDVYNALYSKWGVRIFRNIAQSERRHSDALALLLSRYGLSDPAANKAPGDFENPGLKALYSDLVAEGEASFLAALRVGATVEDLDFHDLEKAVAGTDNEDLKAVYRNLQKGTANHMQVLVQQLKAGGEEYSAQYVSATTLAEMLSTPDNRGAGYGARKAGLRGSRQGSGICPWSSIPTTN
jgi:hypothetical protein